VNKFMSRKFIVTIMVMVAASVLPSAYHGAGVSDTVVLAVLGIIAGIGASYGVLNVKDAQNELKK
jgi:hypothetical protein